ncbi:hypothetical protein M0R45_032995 [Rubus argutus]|uniref:Bulb-type lectin domain-containing protein n=1 Tax=Rubus argutus TaxID=59490 RepID=A0AAW1WIV3_RUBAR
MGWLLRYLVTLLSSLILSFCTCQDKIVPGKFVSGNLTLNSSLGAFSLGFFSPENSTKYFLGIQYNTFLETTIVWVANRESPLDSPGVFMLGSDGNLAVLNEARKVMVWSSNVSVSAVSKNSTTGSLLDTGNLVLPFGVDTLWESFNYPSDHILPSMKISLNKRTGQQSVSDSSVQLRIWLSPTGELELLQWQGSTKTWLPLLKYPDDNCDFYARCGPYSACRRDEPRSSPCKCLTGFTAKFPNQWAAGDWSGGCVRENVLTCGNGILESYFSKLEKVKLPDHSVLYAYVNVTDENNIGNCLAWFGELMDLEIHDIDPYEIYIRVHGSEPGSMGLSVNSLKWSLVIAIVSSAAGLLTIIFGYFLWKKNLGKEGRTTGRMSEIISNISAAREKNNTELPLFNLRSILATTNNFSETNKLGEGGFGPVYKVTLLY